MELTRVQQWVGATLVMAIAFGGIAAPMAYVSTLMADMDGLYARAIGIWVISIVVGLVSVEGALLLLQWRRVSPWLALGVMPAGVASYFLF